MPAAIANSTEEVLQYASARKLASHLCGRVSANCVTTVNIVISALVVYAVTIQSIPMAVAAYALRMFLDDLDGTVARTCNERSTFGHCYEHIVDMLMAIAIAGALSYTYFGLDAAIKVTIAASVVSVIFHYLMFNTGKTKEDDDASWATKVTNFIFDDNPTVFGIVLLTVLMLTLPMVATRPPHANM